MSKQQAATVETGEHKPDSAPLGGSDDLRLIMVKAPDDHVIQKYDSIDAPCWTPRGTVFAPSLACNVPDAVGKLAREYNAAGRQVWTGKMLPVRGGKISRQCEWYKGPKAKQCHKPATYEVLADHWEKPVPVCDHHADICRGVGFQVRQNVPDQLSGDSNRKPK